MQTLSDLEFIEELRNRLEAKDRAYHELSAITAKLEELNRKLVESEELKSNFLSNIRNEINNPLASVLATAELLISESDLPDPTTLKSIINLIHKDAFALNFQLRNIFVAAELEAGEAEPVSTSTDVNSLINESVSSLTRSAIEKNIKIICEISDGLRDSSFKTDAEKFHRIFINLLANAIEYSCHGGEVRACARKADGCLVLTVKDLGIGIDKSDHQLIFERFRQLERGASKHHAGHGLGLSIVKASVELLGGTITVDSSTGKGALFTVILPEAVTSDTRDFLNGTEFFDTSEGERF